MGLVECLAGQASLAEALVEDEASGMWVLPTIPGAGNPPDLLGSEAMGTLLEKLKTDFDLVVIDSAPRVKYDLFARVLDIAREAGAENFSIIK